MQLLERFNGSNIQYVRAERRRQVFTKLPPYIIVHYKRFSKNQFFMEKNVTSVSVRESCCLFVFLFVCLGYPSLVLLVPNGCAQFPIRNLDLSGLVKGGAKDAQSARYNLIANISHDGPAEGGKFRVHVFHKALGKWLEMSDVDVQEKAPDNIMLLDVYIQIFERSTAPTSAASADAQMQT